MNLLVMGYQLGLHTATDLPDHLTSLDVCVCGVRQYSITDHTYAIITYDFSKNTCKAVNLDTISLFRNLMSTMPYTHLYYSLYHCM